MVEKLSKTNEMENLINISSPKDLLKTSWAIYTKKLGLLLGILAIPFALSILIEPSYLISKSLGTFLSSISLVVFFWSQVAILFAIIDERDNPPFQEVVKKGWSKIVPFVWLSVLSTFIVGGGFFLAVIPGIILSVWFLFSSFVFIVEDRGGMNALMRSKQLATGYWLNIFGKIVFLLILILLLIFPINIIMESMSIDPDFVNDLISAFIATPIALIFFYLIYTDLAIIKKDAPEVVVTKKDKIKFAAIGLIGWIIGLIIIAMILAGLSNTII